MLTFSWYSVPYFCGLPHQAFVKIVLKTVTPEATAFARDIEQELAELDRQVDILVVAG